eukprot:CAMPEP_0202827868 /NCGR_PEP_ID=MMETSP1389-20130828/14569_1 /ASSEMBLY_ACC=CAM_ASM_000865 /TAXON_ID=302021 /ORGANISM="Rhodomonas sp., Strain CCMP768" /LENGTH=91 /DNA_ID=CAMNT_0049501321 /DNA_START=39 /DNA_END=311 /DNA_ORIENTATION=+
MSSMHQIAIQQRDLTHASSARGVEGDQNELRLARFDLKAMQTLGEVVDGVDLRGPLLGPEHAHLCAHLPGAREYENEIAFDEETHVAPRHR